MYYEKNRSLELENHRMSMENEKQRFKTDIKRSCLEFARQYEPENVDELLKEADKIYDFISK